MNAHNLSKYGLLSMAYCLNQEYTFKYQTMIIDCLDVKTKVEMMV